MHTQNIVKNLLVAITLAVAAVASWAVTDFSEPTIEASAATARHG